MGSAWHAQLTRDFSVPRVGVLTSGGRGCPADGPGPLRGGSPAVRQGRVDAVRRVART